jgi:hypothetical protein
MIITQQGQRDDIHRIKSFTPHMLLNNIFTFAKDHRTCESGILMCGGSEYGIYNYMACDCQGVICAICAQWLAQNAIKCQACHDKQNTDHDIVIGFKCPTCRKFIPLH